MRPARTPVDAPGLGKLNLGHFRLNHQSVDRLIQDPKEGGNLNARRGLSQHHVTVNTISRVGRLRFVENTGLGANGMAKNLNIPAAAAGDRVQASQTMSSEGSGADALGAS